MGMNYEKFGRRRKFAPPKFLRLVTEIRRKADRNQIPATSEQIRDGADTNKSAWFRCQRVPVIVTNCCLVSTGPAGFEPSWSGPPAMRFDPGSGSGRIWAPKLVLPR